MHILFDICIYLSLPPVPYITSLQPRTDYSFVQNGSDVKGATWEPDECLPTSLDHIRLRLKLDWVETLFQYLTARNTIYYLIYVALMIPFFRCLVLFDEPPILLSEFCYTFFVGSI